PKTPPCAKSSKARSATRRRRPKTWRAVNASGLSGELILCARLQPCGLSRVLPACLRLRFTPIGLPSLAGGLSNRAPMKFIRLLVFFASLLSRIAARATDNELTAAEKSACWQLLFDGRTFNGWRGYRMKTMPETGWEI